MTGRDIGTAARSYSRRGRGLLAGSILGVVALLGIAIGSHISHSQPAALPPAPARDTARDDALARARPARSERTTSGAVAAAARSITAFDGDVLLQPQRLQAVVTNIASRGARPQLLAAYRQASAETRVKLGADTAPRPVIVLRSVPVGYRVEQFSPGGATVDVWYVGIVASGATVQPQQSWRTQTVTLVWERRAWKVASFASLPGPTPALLTTDVDQPGGLFAAMPRFQEFDHVEP
jgi:hypothetical protein